MKLQLFKNRDSQWCWRLIAHNGRSIAIGGEGYGRRRDALRGASRALWLTVRKDIRIAP